VKEAAFATGGRTRNNYRQARRKALTKRGSISFFFSFSLYSAKDTENLGEKLKDV
jgi:hypothetical protein